MNLLDDGVALALGATALLAVTRTLKVQAYAGSVARYPSYPYYVVCGRCEAQVRRGHLGAGS
jgi:hypothetical protein